MLWNWVKTRKEIIYIYIFSSWILNFIGSLGSIVFKTQSSGTVFISTNTLTCLIWCSDTMGFNNVFLLGVATCHGYVTWNVLLTILFFLFEPTSKYFFNKFILNNFLFLLFSHLSFYLFFLHKYCIAYNSRWIIFFNWNGWVWFVFNIYWFVFCFIINFI